MVHLSHEFIELLEQHDISVRLLFCDGQYSFAFELTSDDDDVMVWLKLKCKGAERWPDPIYTHSIPLPPEEYRKPICEI